MKKRRMNNIRISSEKTATLWIGVLTLLTGTMMSVSASARSLLQQQSHWPNSPLIVSPYTSTRRSTRRQKGTDPFTDIQSTTFVARKSTINRASETRQVPTERPDNYPDYSFSDLGPIGRTVAGVTSVAFAVLWEYATGFLSGLLFGTVVGIPGFVFRPTDPTVRRAFSAEIRGRFARMNGRSMKWAKTYGGFSATFGGCGVAVRVLRGGEEDVWTEVFSSAAAGAFIHRKDGPQVMLQYALLYAGFVYFFSGGLGRKKPLQQYTDQPVSTFYNRQATLLDGWRPDDSSHI